MFQCFACRATVLAASLLLTCSAAALPAFPAGACLREPGPSVALSLLQMEAKQMPWSGSWPSLWPWLPKGQTVIETSQVHKDLEVQEDLEEPQVQDEVEESRLSEMLESSKPDVMKAHEAQQVMYAQFYNYCVSRLGDDLKQDGGHPTPGGVADCKALCNADAFCSGFEWYQAGWQHGHHCFLISGGRHAKRGAFAATKFRDARCFVKNMIPSGQAGLIED
eukprot:CAMPEP_0170602454 /NCGR_PEP_ID=MMETSP0224-20130122/18397_1 /TAXON_ID=285029 /ORGANISM="Togula jolla, Strain CCCM 725" /LENGTH=220 /DNA_ID=CAMNT_0010927289 /DNA_START=50 /DNA_END=712 /DNA_ORIENTATION=-